MGESLGRWRLGVQSRCSPSRSFWRAVQNPLYTSTCARLPSSPVTSLLKLHFTQQRCQQLLRARASHTHKPAAQVRLGPQKGLEQSCRSCMLDEAGGGPWLQASSALPGSDSCSIFYPAFRALGLWVKTGAGPRGVGRGVSQGRLGGSKESLPPAHTHTHTMIFPF